MWISPDGMGERASGNKFSGLRDRWIDNIFRTANEDLMYSVLANHIASEFKQSLKEPFIVQLQKYISQLWWPDLNLHAQNEKAEFSYLNTACHMQVKVRHPQNCHCVYIFLVGSCSWISLRFDVILDKRQSFHRSCVIWHATTALEKRRFGWKLGEKKSQKDRTWRSTKPRTRKNKVERCLVKGNYWRTSPLKLTQR